MSIRSLVVLLLAVAPALAGTPHSIRLSDGRSVPVPPRESSLPDAVDAGQHYLAAPLDRDGRLREALPLYRDRAEKTQTDADRLRYAGALLRAGEREQAMGIYDELIVEGGSGAHGRTSGNAALCASSLLMQGFPELAVERLRGAASGDRRVALLRARALVAAGDVTGARRVIRETSIEMETWSDAERAELARLHVLVGDVRGGKALLDREYPAALEQFVRDSVLADVSFWAGDWPTVAKVLTDAKRKAPSALDEPRVNRTWRNLQRELRRMQLRLAVALWRQGRSDAAMEEARRAATSDEEYVRSAAELILVGGELVAGERNEAMKRLAALGGHDRRFAPGARELGQALGVGGDPAGAIAALEDALGSEDRALDYVTRPIAEVMLEAARPAPAKTATATQ